LRSLLLAKNGLNKIRAQHKELKQADLEDSIKSVPPGEWCLLKHPDSTSSWLCFINSMIEEKFNSIQILAAVDSKTTNLEPADFIVEKLKSAFAKRQRFSGYENGSRIFYGASDGLPGLIIDQFMNKAIIQINTAGVDKHRLLVKQTVDSLITGTSYFLDNAKYREKEFLPTFETEALPNLTIEENGIKYSLRSEVLQKVGFYYDHRENRYQLMQLLKRLNQKFEHATDLFCYAGAWGLCALQAGVNQVSFVDQGDFNTEIQTALELNSFSGRGNFYRSDVFKFLDEAISKNNLFDLILCDPPAFAKSQSQKDQALEGYSKLHRKVFKASKPGALIAFSSCTHYVSHDEFQKNILDAATKENKKLQLIYSGMQGWDHPVPSLMDKSNYIKSYFYLMES
jgi:23S rRNA (cytosine1962-C5)-methyltransferase